MVDLSLIKVSDDPKDLDPRTVHEAASCLPLSWMCTMK